MGGVGSGGQNRKSPAQHRLTGTRPAYRTPTKGNEAAVGRLAAVPDPPAHLGEAGRRLWEEAAGFLVRAGRLSTVDLPFLQALAELYETARACAEAIRRDGPAPGGRPHPLLPSLSKVSAEVVKLADRLMLLPLARERLGLVEPGDDEDDFMAFLRRRQQRAQSGRSSVLHELWDAQGQR